MRRVLLTGDLHVNKGVFVDIGLEYLNYIGQYVLDNKIETIVFLGDIFERSARIYNESFVPIFTELYKMSRGHRLIFILGNHDIYSSNMKDSVIQTFNSFGRVITKREETIEDEVCFLSYTKEEGDLQEKASKYLMTHLAIADFKFDNNYHVNERIAFKPDLFREYKWVFSGHFHNHQHRGNIIYVGSPYQISYGEEGQAKGFIILDLDTGEWDFIEYGNAPEFIKIDIDDVARINEIDFKNKFVKIKINKKVDEFVKLKYILFEKGALDIVPEFESSEVELSDEGVDVDLNSSISDVIRDYIMNIDIKGIDNKKLLEIFDEIKKEGIK